MNTYNFNISRTTSFKDYESFIDKTYLNGSSKQALNDFKFNPAIRCYTLHNSKKCPQYEFARILVDKKGDAFFDEMTLDNFYIVSVLQSFKKSNMFPHLYIPSKFDKYVAFASLKEVKVPLEPDEPISFVKNLRHRSPQRVLKYF